VVVGFALDGRRSCGQVRPGYLDILVCVLSASHRLLRLLTVLSTRPEWTGAELAGRLGIHERTVRRDIAKLRELGYGIEAATGPWGGYRLGAGSQMPPLSLDDDEALATAIALRQLAWRSPDGEGHAALGALVKLQQSLPRRVADSLRRFDSTVAEAGEPSEPAVWGQVDHAVLVGLAGSCRARDRVRVSYRDRRGADSDRELEPFRVVRTAHRWYLVAWDLHRADWRVFRVDRIRDLAVTGRADPRRPDVDAAAMVESAITSTPYEVYADIEIPRPLAEVRALIPATVARHRADGPERTVTRLGGPSAHWIAGYLLRLGVQFRVIAPDQVRQLVVEHLEELLALQQKGPGRTDMRSEPVRDSP
jgi:predicted DNA-binding transcriptional regulator YafY